MTSVGVSEKVEDARAVSAPEAPLEPAALDNVVTGVCDLRDLILRLWIKLQDGLGRDPIMWTLEEQEAVRFVLDVIPVLYGLADSDGLDIDQKDFPH